MFGPTKKNIVVLFSMYDLFIVRILTTNPKQQILMWWIDSNEKIFSASKTSNFQRNSPGYGTLRIKLLHVMHSAYNVNRVHNKFQHIHYSNTGKLKTLQWRHNDHGGVSNHQPHGCSLNRLFRHRSKKTPKLRITGLCAGNSPGPVNSPHKGPVTRKMFPFDDVIMNTPYLALPEDLLDVCFYIIVQ